MDDVLVVHVPVIIDINTGGQRLMMMMTMVSMSIN